MNPIGALLCAAACLLCAFGSSTVRAQQAAPRLHTDNDDYDEDYANETVPEAGSYVGGPCTGTCSPTLLHVHCDAATSRCECDTKYPVLVGAGRGCTEVKKLGEQCFYLQSCEHYDEHSSCVQVNHNAVCQCDLGYHSVSYQRPTKRVFCTEGQNGSIPDMSVLTADVPTLLGVTTGIAVLAGLICFVLHLFSRARYPRPRHYADANEPPPILFSGSETGIPMSMAVHARSSSRASQRSAGSLTSGYSRRPSSAPPGSRGVLVSASRAGAARSAAILLISRHVKEISENQTGSTGTSTGNGRVSPASSRILVNDSDDLPVENDSNAVRTIRQAHKHRYYLDASKIFCSSRRPSLASLHSGSSVRSYSHRRYERELEQKEARQEMKMHLARIQAANNFNNNNGGTGTRREGFTPSPRTPNSTDELLPTITDDSSDLSLPTSTTVVNRGSSEYKGEIGPCSSAEPY